MAANLRFLSSKTVTTPSAIILGAPLDITESFRSGAGLAPSRIREFSDSIESYSPLLDADLEDMNLADWGDIPLEGKDMSGSLAAIEEAVSRTIDLAPVVLLGGEHTISLAAVTAMKKHYRDLAVLQLDAHLDLIDSLEGLYVSHGTAFRRISDVIGLQSLAQIGVRSGTRGEFTLARKCLHSSPDLSLPATVRSSLQARPVYLSIDIDVLDPAYAPGTGNPEPGGCSFRELMDFLYCLRGLDIVGMDIVEVSPPLDPSSITSVAAAMLVRELVLLFGRNVT